MKLKDIFRIFRRNWFYIVCFPIMLAAFVFYLTGQTKKKYTSDFIVYTGIASGYKLTSEENPRSDFFLVNNAFDNLITTLKARQTLEEVGLRLLSYHLVNDSLDWIMTAENHERLKILLPYAWRKAIVDKSSEENTYQNLLKLKEGPGGGLIVGILESDYYVYGVAYMRNGMACKRKDNSDMLEIYYSSDDPAVSQKTLYILSEVFFGKYKTLKESEIIRVVKYFTDKAETNRKRLKDAEDNLRLFGQEHKILNFYEQSSQLTSSRKELHAQLEGAKLTLAAAQSTCRKLAEKLEGRTKIFENNQDIIEKRRVLNDLNNKIANADIKKINGNQLLALKEQAEILKGEIKNIVKNLYKLYHTEEGVANESLINQYLGNLLLADETFAKINLMVELDKEYESLFNKYAPLGAILSSLEREIKVAETEYMQAITALNTNLQKQQNLSLNANLKMVDYPIFPNIPDKDKRMVLVFGAWFAGLSLILGYLVGKVVLNDTIRTPSRAERETGLETVGIFPFIPDFKNSKHNYDGLENSFSNQCAGSLILSTKKDTKPSKIIVTGTRPGEGKIRVSAVLACKLSEINGKILLLYPHTEKIEIESFLKCCKSGLDKLITKEFSLRDEFVEISSLEALVSGIDFKQFDYIITVIPSLNESKIPVGLLKGNVLPVLVINAERTWTESDAYFLKLFSKACTNKPLALLNKVSFDALEDIFGKIPGKKVIKDKEKNVFGRFKLLKVS